jgi:predicted dehydrogenase
MGDRKNVTRRKFLEHSAAFAGMLAVPYVIPSSAIGLDDNTAPSERISLGTIGKGVMGSVHLQKLTGDPGFQVLAVCEVDRVRRESAKHVVEQQYAADRARGAYRGCAAYNDYRELLARPDIDAVVIATPDHWHALQAVDAAKAGKDIYCEKPISLTIYEGRRVVEAVRRYGRVFQTGTQYRSNPMIRKVCQFIRDGRLGKVKSVYTLFQNLGNWIGGASFKPYARVIDIETCGKSYAPLEFPFPAETAPDGLDWDLWVGPAPWHPYNPVYHRNPAPGVVPWAFCESFGAASLTGFLAHAADVIQYALGVEESGPVEIVHPHTGEFPTLTCKYANGTLLHFVDHWEMVKDVYQAVPATAKLAGNFGGVFVGERGWITSMTGGGTVEGGPEEIVKELDLKNPDVKAGRNNHLANWLECIRTRKRPSSDEELGHRCASLGHLAHIACRTGRSLKWDPAKEEFVGDEYANRLRSRAMRAPWRI